MPSPPESHPRRLPVAAACAFLLAAACVALYPVVSGRSSFFHWDLFYEHVPVWHSVQQMLRAGETPFWVDGQYGGNPLLYTQEAPLFYPLTVPLVVSGLPAHRLADIFSLVHFAAAGLLAFALVLDLTRRPGAAFVSGLSWMLGARVVQSAIWPNAVAVAALLPGLALGIVRIGRGQRRSGIVLATLCGGLMGLTARPQAYLGAVPLVVAIAAASAAHARQPRRATAGLALAALLAAGLAAPSVLPTLLLHAEMDRSAGLTAAERNVGALTASEIGLVFLPVNGKDSFPEAACYAGAAAELLFLAGFALCLRPGRLRPVFFALAAGGSLGLVMAFGDAGPYRLVSGLPLLRDLHVPARFLISWAFAVSVCAGLAAAALAERGKAGALLVGLAVAALVPDLVLDVRRTAPAIDSGFYRTTPDLAAHLARLPADAAGFPPRFWTTGVGLVDPRDPRATPAWARREEPLAGALGLRFGLEGMEGRGPALLRIRRLVDSRTLAAGRLFGISRLVSEAPEIQLPRDATAPPGLGVYALPGSPPRAFVVPEAVVLPRAVVERAVLSPTFSPRRTVLLEEPGPYTGKAGWDAASGTAHAVSRRPGHIVLETSAPGPGFLVLLDAFEGGWEASVDGAPAPLLVADAAFRAVPLPVGGHRVEMRYHARGVTEGAGLALAALLGLTLAVRRLPDDVVP